MIICAVFATAVTAVIVPASVWLMLASRSAVPPRLSSVAWSLMALWMLGKLWTATLWQQDSLAWRAAYSRDTAELQRQNRELIQGR
jgi:hypothetical protein